MNNGTVGQASAVDETATHAAADYAFLDDSSYELVGGGNSANNL